MRIFLCPICRTPLSATNDDTKEGLVAVISVKIPEPQFEGQTKSKLGNSSVRPLVDRSVAETLSNFFEENPNCPCKMKIKTHFTMNFFEKNQKAIRDLRQFPFTEKSVYRGTHPYFARQEMHPEKDFFRP